MMSLYGKVMNQLFSIIKKNFVNNHVKNFLLALQIPSNHILYLCKSEILNLLNKHVINKIMRIYRKTFCRHYKYRLMVNCESGIFVT